MTFQLEHKSESESVKSLPTLLTPWAEALQSPLSMEFSRQEYWSEESFPSPGIKPGSLALQADS